MHVLDERNGWLYVKETTADYFEPRYIIHWWPTGLRWVNHRILFADEERARATLGQTLVSLNNYTYRLDLGIAGGLRIALRDGGKTKPEHTELVPIPEPVQRGKKKPVRWYHGSWQKQMAKGWVAA